MCALIFMSLVWFTPANDLGLAYIEQDALHWTMIDDYQDSQDSDSSPGNLAY